MPNDLVLKAANLMHRSLVLFSGGRLGWEMVGMPVVEITTTGRKSGQPRTVMLTTPLQQGSTTVLVASRGGDDQHPAWFLNLQANPGVEVKIGGGAKQQMQARIATTAERAELWPQVIEVQPRYAGYQERTEREIPLVLLEPVA